MKRNRIVRIVAMVIVAGGARVVAASPATPAPAPTFSKDVAPILFKRCATCHRPGEVAPMSLLSYEEARPWAKAIKTKVVDRQMPPWGADLRYGTFKDARTLSDAEIGTIAAWVDAGAPRGSDKDLPTAPTFATGWSHSEPDFVFELPVEVRIPPEGQLDLQYYWVPIPFAEDRFAQTLEIRPTTPGVLHHARADVVSLPEGAKIVDGKLVAADGATGSPRGDDRAANRPAVDPFDFARSTLISFIPGGGLEEHPVGTGKRIEAGKYVRFEMHYTPTGRPETDRTRIGVWFSKVPVTHEVFTVLNPRTLVPGTNNADPTYIVENQELLPAPAANGGGRRVKIPNIPAYAEDWKLVAVMPVNEPITITSLLPHMHLRGKDLTWIVTWPDGRDEIVLSIPRYDFNWQILYELATPLKLPAGSKITTIAHFDNSAKNRYNPAPEKEVFWSDQSWDEMFVPYMEYTVDGQDLTRSSNTTPRR